MLGLAKDWLLDPLALLFLLSIVTALVLWQLIRRCYSARFIRAGVAMPGGKDKLPVARWWVSAFVMCLLWLAVYAVSTAPFVVNGLIRSMEQPYKTVQCLQGSHIVVLGGGIDSRVETARDFSSMRPATFIRSTQGAQIALAEPDARIVLAGGTLRKITEADVIAEYFSALGIDRQRLLLETESTRTRENAVNVVELLLGGETVSGPVRVVTSALHMRRALASFQRASDATGITFCPVAVDFQGVNPAAFSWMPQTTTIVKFDLWLHEFIALQMYRIRGWL